jgi:hypothetical protein
LGNAKDVIPAREERTWLDGFRSSWRCSVRRGRARRRLRIDYCEACRGYLKTYDGQGNEQLMLADWTSLHLDLLAHDRGLKRLAPSLYELQALVET